MAQQHNTTQFHTARRGDGACVVLEGVHAVKHALRFDANLLAAYTADKKRSCALMYELGGPKESEALKQLLEEVLETELAALAPNALRSSLMALAEHPYATQGTPQPAEGKPIVYLEDPHDLENVGAVIRVAAGYGAAAVITSGSINPWHANCIRGSAGLHFALPVLHIDSLQELPDNRQLVACTTGGENMYTAHIPHNAVLAFGTERHGISDALERTAHSSIAIPMQPNVSSLNLATSVSAVLFGAL
jgi:TrmH family RNA methyltransferase